LIKQKNGLIPATVRFRGSLEDKNGEWVGIEYDEPYGKHDGSYNGKRYFECFDKYGSFVKPAKIVSEISLEDAVKIQYTRDYGMEEKAGEMNSSKLFIKEKPLDELKGISVTDLPVNDMGHEVLKRLCPRANSFDCSNTKIKSWKEVHQALENTNITQLTVSRLKLKTEEDMQFDCVENLILCKCGYNAVEMSEISKMFPNLRQLNFSSNLIESLGPSHFVPSNLTFLDLSRNNLISWKSVVNLLRNCDQLVELNLTETGLNEFELLEPVLKSLKIMIASKNPIADFRSFSNLNLTAPNLKSLSIREVPCVPEDDPTARQEVIARMTNLTSLNRTLIPANDAEVAQTGVRLITRKGAEIDFMNRKANQWFELNNEAETKQFHLQYPRWKELLEKYGEPVRQKQIETRLNSKMITITLRDSKGKSVTKDLLKTTKIKNMQIIFKKLFKAKVKDGDLYFEDSRKIKFRLDDSDKTLDHFNVESGNTIFIK